MYKPPDFGALLCSQEINECLASQLLWCRRPAYVGDMADPQAQINGNYGMGQRPDAGFHGLGAPAEKYQGMRIPGSGDDQLGKILEGVPDGRQRKLALQPSDGKELYHGLGSAFVEWEKSFCDKLASPSVPMFCVA